MSNIKWRNDGSGLGDADYLPDGVVVHDGVYRLPVKGAKKKPKQPRKPVIAKDSAASMSFFKGDYGTSEGEIYGLVDGGKSIFLEGTPLLDDDGNPNFENVTWEERKGTLDQEYMKGFPDVSNEVGIGVELKGGTPWVRSITNTQLSALRLRFKWDRLAKTNPDNGDVTGYRIDYAIDLRTDGGAYQEVLSTKIEDKTSAGYERTHRIDLPESKTGWSVRVRRITPNSDSEYISDNMYIDALAEVIDVKLAYPLTAGIGLQYNAELFNGVAKVEFLKRGRILKVPTNYNAETRQYTGIWDGTFKEAYSNNPAWVYYDLLTNKRYGLGHRLDASMIDKWVIYNLARYCDEMVSDGQGGLEPRFTCNVYLQKQATAYEVLQHIAGIFSALSYWNGEKIFLDADIPRDPVFTFTNANVVGGNFSYSGTRDRDRHNIIKVAWDNPANSFKTEYEYVRDERSIALNGIKPLDLAAFGCTSQSQAQRLGLRALKTEQLETQQVTFSAGLAAINCKVGDVIAISDASLAGKSNGGLISNVDGNVITIDRDAVINIGDTLTVNTAKGLSERRNVTAVNGRNITVAAAFDGAEREHVWSVESSDLKMQLFRVMSVIENDDATYSVLGVQHEPQKFNAIDFGTDVKPTAISIVDDIVITPPESVVIKSRHRVEQGQTVATLIVEWSQVKEAVAYEVEWRKDDGSWVRVPRTGTNSVEIDGVYAGQYLARVRSVGAFDSVSNPTTSILTEVKGKVGKPPKLAHLNAVGILFGMELSWSFAAGSKDADYVEIEQGSAPDTNVSLLGQFSYPTDRHEITGLQGGLTRSYRARLVDKLGFKSDWTEWATATVDDSADKVLDLISGQIDGSHLDQALSQQIDKIDIVGDKVSQEVIDRQNAINQVSQDIADVSAAVDDETQARIDAIKLTGDAIAAEAQARGQEIADLESGFNTKITELEGTDIVINSRLDTIASNVGDNAAAILSESNTRANNDSALSGRIDEIVAVSGGNTALISAESQARADADLALGSRIDAVVTSVDGNSASIASEATARADADTALGVRIDTVSAKSGDNTAAIQSEATARTDGDSALGSRIDTVIAKSDANTAAISSEAKARADEDSALSSRIDTVSSKTDDNAASITNVSNTLTNELGSQAEQINIIKADYSPRYADKTRYADKSRSAQWTYWKTVARDNYATNERITVLQSDVADSKAEITQSLNTLATKDEALASSIDAIAVKTGSNTAAIQSESVARTDADSALSTRIDTVVATAGDNTAAIQAEQEARADAYSALSQRVDTVQSSTATAQTTAEQAIADAQSKADAAEQAAKDYALAQAKAEADAAKAAASSDAAAKAAAAESAAKAAAALDAKDKADAALAAAKLDATAKADAAKDLANAAQNAANNAATAAGNKGEVIYQSQTPAASKRLAQNLWIDTTGGKNTPKRWDGASWVAVTDKAALDAQNAANEAQSTADEALGKANTATSNIATIKTELTATTSKTNATATSVGTLQTTVAGNTASIQTQQSSINGLSAQSVLTLDVNGYVTGHGTYNDGKKGTFAVRADEFWIGGTDGTSQKGFVYYTSPQTINGVTVPKGLYLDSATIANGTLDAAKIKDATITSAKIGEAAIESANIDDLAVTSGKIGNAAITSAKIGDAAIETAHIGNAQVNTLQIAGNAVTVPVSTYLPNSVAVNAANWADVVSVSVPAGGYPALISFMIESIGLTTATSVNTFRLKLVRGGSIIREIKYPAKLSSGSSEIESISWASIVDDVPVGGATYTVQILWPGSTILGARSLTSFGVKR